MASYLFYGKCNQYSYIGVSDGMSLFKKFLSQFLDDSLENSKSNLFDTKSL